MKTSTKLIWGVVIIATYFHFKDGTPVKAEAEEASQSKMTEEEISDAKEFAQNLILSRDYKCDKLTGFVPANLAHAEVNVWCDDVYHYEITKPGGRWKVVAK